jgi:4-hydroxy-tetrahydrodipicolinate synthase
LFSKQKKEEKAVAIFKGAGVAIITPMKENLEVNYDKLDEILEEQIAGKTDSIIICGTTGESATLTEQEHMDVIKFTIERVNHRIPVIAGTGSNSTATAVQLSKEAAAAGAEGLLLVTPYYNKATQNGLIAHYTRIANEAKIPAVLYNVPSRTGCAIQPETVAHLIKNVEYITGIKEASGNIGNVAKIMHLCDGKIDLYSGNDDQIVPLLSLGGLGVISVLSNVAPKYVHDMVYKFFDGDVQGSCKMQLQALPLCDALFCEVNPIPVKAAMNLMGKECGPLRGPLTEIEPQHKELLKKAMQEFGIL